MGSRRLDSWPCHRLENHKANEGRCCGMLWPKMAEVLVKSCELRRIARGVESFASGMEVAGGGGLIQRSWRPMTLQLVQWPGIW